MYYYEKYINKNLGHLLVLCFGLSSSHNLAHNLKEKNREGN